VGVRLQHRHPRLRRLNEPAGCRWTNSSAPAITGPLGMKDTQFYLPAGQRRAPGGGIRERTDGKIVRARPTARAARGITSTARTRVFAGGAGAIVDGARLRALPRNDPSRR
jgi:CubicO group peptidase (beta-lactamase class C family)